MPRVSLVLLTWNEIEGLRHHLPILKDFARLGVDEIFAVDGGSTDGSLELYAQHGIRVLQQRSRGRGEAMRFAAENAKSDYIVFFSPDGNENWQDIPKFKSFFDGQTDLVIASRMMKGARNEEDIHLLRWRKWANNAFNLLANLFFRRIGQYVTDSINGFRGVRRTLLQELQLDAVGYTIEYQMTIRSFKMKKVIVEFPTQEGQRIGGETKAPSIPTGLRFLKCLWQELCTR
ncbi:MAG: glycosyltransferase family 2 protein [Bdellovibrionales bacterium]